MPTPAIYQDREITPRGLLTSGPWRLKVYEIRSPDALRHNVAADGEAFAGGMESATCWLPPQASPPGLGWLIRHVGAGANYVVVARWGNLNELFIHTLAATGESPQPVWTPGGERFSFCVWDMQVLWHERGAYVRHMLSGTQSPEAYLADRLAINPAAAAH